MSIIKIYLRVLKGIDLVQGRVYCKRGKKDLPLYNVGKCITQNIVTCY